MRNSCVEIEHTFLNYDFKPKFVKTTSGALRAREIFSVKNFSRFQHLFRSHDSLLGFKLTLNSENCVECPNTAKMRKSGPKTVLSKISAVSRIHAGFLCSYDVQCCFLLARRLSRQTTASNEQDLQKCVDGRFAPFLDVYNAFACQWRLFEVQPSLVSVRARQVRMERSVSNEILIKAEHTCTC